MAKKYTQEEFIEKAKAIHGDKYDYSKVEYVNGRTKICIICPEHGEFWQIPNSHLMGKGCKMCGIENTVSKNSDTQKDFIEKAKAIHGDKYDYSKVKYIDSSTKVCIICQEHGEFWQRPYCHIQGQGCYKCGIKKNSNAYRKNNSDFIKNAALIHNNKYNYSKVEYINNHTKVCIICPEHGEFWQTPKHHLHGHGCPFCSNRFGYTNESFKSAANKIHNNKYDYSKVEYINASAKICIICPKHGEFWQMPYCHIQGQGCPKCNESHLEREIRELLERKGINFSYRERKLGWLGGLELDFYLPDLNMAIECQGIQHYEPTSFSGDKSDETANANFEIVSERDKRKAQLCNENGVRLFYFTHYDDITEEGNIYKDKDKLLNEIFSVKCH